MGKIAKLVNGAVRMVSTTVQYQETIVVPGGGYPGSTTLTLPSSGSYYSSDLSVFLDGQLLTVGADFNYVGSGARTQIITLVPLFEGERLTYRIDSF